MRVELKRAPQPAPLDSVKVELGHAPQPALQPRQPFIPPGKKRQRSMLCYTNQTCSHIIIFRSCFHLLLIPLLKFSNRLVTCVLGGCILSLIFLKRNIEKWNADMT